MSQFEGGNKVRCIDCTRLDGSHCSAKGSKVSPRKRRTCTSYQFQGEYVNRDPLPAVYVPHVSKKTRSLMKRLVKLGVTPEKEDITRQTEEGLYYKKDTLEVPGTTATASPKDLVAEDQKQRWVQPTSAVDPDTEVWAPAPEEPVEKDE